MKDLVGHFVKFIKETRAETKKVVWPDRRYVVVATMIILVLVVITGIYVMMVDFAFTKVFGVLMK
ncbi:preprotein translocase subunit SecE [Candidatus Margulisiibacteriota bacterium]